MKIFQTGFLGTEACSAQDRTIPVGTVVRLWQTGSSCEAPPTKLEGKEYKYNNINISIQINDNIS